MREIRHLNEFAKRKLQEFEETHERKETAMSDAKHTKGPWKWRANQIIGDERPCADGFTGRVVCSFGEMWKKDEEMKANSRLIAAAPRMYDRIVQLAANGDAEANSILEEINGTHGKS